MYEQGNWEQGRAVWFLGIHNSNLLCSVAWLRYFLNQRPQSVKTFLKIWENIWKSRFLNSRGWRWQIMFLFAQLCDVDILYFKPDVYIPSYLANIQIEYEVRTNYTKWRHCHVHCIHVNTRLYCNVGIHSTNSRGSQRDVVYLGWPTAPRMWAQRREKEGGCGVSANDTEYSCAKGNQINFGDLWLNRTYHRYLISSITIRRARYFYFANITSMPGPDVCSRSGEHWSHHVEA